MSAGGALVLLYHRVAELERDPYGLAVAPERFAIHCEILRRRGVVLPLEECRGSVGRVALTFDDGYGDNAWQAAGILADAQLPATFFLTAGRLGERREIWWDRLEQLLLGTRRSASAIDVEVAGRRVWIDIRSAAARERALFALFWRLRPLAPEAIEVLLDELEARLGARTVDRETHRWMTVDELRSLASRDGVAIGAHTLTHPLLAGLDPERQWREIDGSRRMLQEVIGGTVTAFSYPYGGREAFEAGTTEMVRRAGYTMACTVTGGLVPADGDPLLVPRNVVGDWDGNRFEQWLDRWLAAP